jgi:2-polyprenyl-6-methoxyphenol hydroxylase-like FAD-dependent oxidoreductase
VTNNLVIIAGGGIGGLATALTLHQIDVPCIVFEAVREMRSLGVGINLQPNAVREIYDLGITQADLDCVGLPAKEWALVGLNGNDIYSEPRGLLAGYKWPQYAVHRGRFHMLLYDKLVERAGRNAVQLGHRVTGYSHRFEYDAWHVDLVERKRASSAASPGGRFSVESPSFGTSELAAVKASVARLEAEVRELRDQIAKLHAQLGIK